MFETDGVPPGVKLIDGRGRELWYDKSAFAMKNSMKSARASRYGLGIFRGLMSTLFGELIQEI